MRQKAKLTLVALAGAVVGAVLARRRRPVEAPATSDQRTDELRRKLEEAKEATVPAEPESPPTEAPAAETPAPSETVAPEPAPPEPAPPGPSPPAGETAPPQDEFEAMRRRIHEEGRAAAQEMRSSTDRPDER